MFCEGMNEAIFLKHLKGNYSSDRKVITIKPGSGGSPMMVVQGAIRYMLCHAFEKVVVVLDDDGDPGRMEEVRHLAEREGIDLILNTPCLEALLLSILGDPGRISDTISSQEYKRKFEERYIPREKRKDVRKYSIFTKEILDNKRRDIEELDRMIRVLEEETE